MSVDVINLEWLGANVRQLQADVRTLRLEMTSQNRRFDQVMDRLATFEAVTETRFDQMTILLDTRLDTIVAMMKENDHERYEKCR